MPVYDYAFPAVDSSVVNSVTSGAQAGPIINGINTRLTENLIQSINGADSNSNNTLTYGMYINRNQTIANIATDMTNQNNRQDGAKDTYTRQAEINEWQAQNKLDTLFFLQILFLFFVLVVILIFLRRYGLLTTGSFYTVATILVIILIGVLWNRASYTMYSRDKRYWNRRYLGLNDSGLQAKLQCANA